MTREEELELFRKVCGKNRITKYDHTNSISGNRTKAGNFNQGVVKAKFEEFVKKEGEAFGKWLSL